MNAPSLKKFRTDLEFIAGWVKDNAYVLDLGCGSGAWMEYLQMTKGCTGYGVEIDDLKIPPCIRRGVNVIQHDLEHGLPYFKNDTFDTVFCLLALQMLKNVEPLMKEIARVGKEAVVSFPNFAYWRNLETLNKDCRMPVSEELPYEWYNSPNLRFATMHDFEELADRVGFEILDRVVLHEGEVVTDNPYRNGSLAVYRLQKKTAASLG
ncbi:MAG: methionine biosynthesis protein MetW [Oxalobacter sp.]|nr:methionine biosynthesis protein MetW [Oxalobacter sp.]